MKIGVKYCGGCNPRFDRAKLLDRIKARYAGGEVAFSYAKPGEQYDVLLVINGCERSCADIRGLRTERVIEIIKDEVPDLL